MAFIDKTPVVPGFKLDLPLYVGGKTKTKRNGSMTKPTKKYWLNMNNYRNWHYQTLNSTKIMFKEAVKDQINILPNLTELWGVICFQYRLYPPNFAERDLNNTVSVVDKYFADALVELGKLKDDNCSFLKAYSCEARDVDKSNPRLEVVIRPFVITDS